MKASSSPSSETLTELGRRKDRLSVSPPWLAKRVILWRHWSVQSCPSYSASAAVSTCLSVVPAVFASLTEPQVAAELSRTYLNKDTLYFTTSLYNLLYKIRSLF